VHQLDPGKPRPGITQFVPYVDPNPAAFLNNMVLFSSYTIGAPVPEIDLDDFFGTYQSWYGSISNAPNF